MEENHFSSVLTKRKMRFRIIIFYLSTSVFVLHAQALRFGSIAADAGVGAGGYYVYTHFPVEVSEINFGEAFISSLPVANLEFCLTRWLGIGIKYRTAFYKTYNSNFISGTDVSYRLTFYIGSKNTKKFNIPLGISYGASDFKYIPNGGGHIFASGNVLNLHISPHIYPTKLLGFYFSVGFNAHWFDKIEYLDTDGRIYTEADDYQLLMYGIYGEIGLAFRLNLLPNLRKEKKPEPEPLSKQAITY